ncbi:hypothetical protein [Hymenobacter guriensis]|uniref:DUF4292 domain-containing protein n=1 Tax=Hymenobacter guriensis TaxID=2793065 RepID=A0ABS0L4J3_9BACT|nr:hypothetical protein [Hymenobacter guriensis]MBG8554297.1 hypothetical protein [Hymenobacter guriensis]
MKKVFYCCLSVGLGLTGSGACAQSIKADSSAVTAAISSLSQRYSDGLRYESRLYNGPEYVSTVRSYIKGHAFLASADPQPATVEYGGAMYTGIALRYDLLRDLLVVKAPLGALDMQLVSERVTRFTLDDRQFVRLVVDSASASPVRTGFYEVLLDGPVQVLAARRKNMQQRSTATGMEGEITQKDSYFIGKGTRYYGVDNAKTVLVLFPQNKAALRKYIRTEKLKFGKTSREASLVELARYQATLPPAPGQ